MFDRRAFLKLAGLGSAAVAGTAVASPLTSVKFDRNLYKTSKTRMLMGTFVNITVLHPSKDRAEEAVDRAFELIASKEAILTRFSDNSPIGALNKEGRLKGLEPDVAKNIEMAIHYHSLSGGAFDITVKPVIDAVRNSFVRFNKPPSETTLEGALKKVGLEHLRLNASSIMFDREGMGITLDGIAKGYIADRAAESLKAAGLNHILVNAGGDMRAFGGRDESHAWRIAVRDPQRNDQYACVINIKDGAVATSGNYEVYFDREKMFHHIVDPSSGNSPHGSQSASIFCSNTTMADALSTAVFVMGPGQGVKFLNKLPGVEGMIITSNGDKRYTTGWNSLKV